MNLQKGDVFFILNKKRWISNAMAWFMRSRWSHCGIIKEVTPSDIYTIETSDLQVWIGQFKEYVEGDFDVEVWRPITVGKPVVYDAVSEAEKHIGTIYGYFQVLLGFTVSTMLERIGVHFRNPIKWGVVCCGVVFYAYHKKLPGFNENPEGRHTEHLYKLISRETQQWALVYEKVAK